MVPQKRNRFFHGFIFIEFNRKSTLLITAVMDDGYVFDGDPVHCKDSCDRRYGTALIYDIAVDTVAFLDRAV